MIKIYLASDHGGYALKQDIKNHFLKGVVVDLGAFDPGSVDYPDFIAPLVDDVLKSDQNRGILICGSGIGMCIGANRFSGIRAMVGYGLGDVHLGRAHNDVNVLCLAGRSTTPALALDLINMFLTTPFDGGRHVRRLEKLDSLCS